MQENGNLAVLVVDPNPGMRTSLQNMLNLAGINKVEYAINANTAIRQLQRRAYDVILCEYDLAGGSGEGQDGQQLLEDLRHHHLISASTIFIMLTSEGVHDKVVSAAELTPTDYVLKPFTVEMLSGRIKRALERRAALLPAWQLAAQGKPREAIAACRDGAGAQPRYGADFARIRAELHTSLNEHHEAAAVYREVLAERPLGWAALGMARTLFALDQVDDARTILEELLAANPRLMAGYDLLARCLEASHEPELAKKVLEDAVAISPHVVRRLRKLGEVALAAGDVDGAEKSFRQVVTKARYSEFRNPEDHVNLVKALVTRDDLLGATGVVRDLERSMRGNPAADACRAYANSLVLDKSGNAGAAIAELQAAVTAVAVALVPAAQWFVAGQSLEAAGLAGFWLDIVVTDGTNTKDEKAAYVAAVFAAMADLIGPLHTESYVLVREVKADAYGYGGRTQEARYVQSKMKAA